MHFFRLAIGASLVISATVGLAQEICNPCVDPPTTQPQQRDRFAPAPTLVITDEEFVSAADLIRQLPSQPLFRWVPYLQSGVPAGIRVTEISDEPTNAAFLAGLRVNDLILLPAETVPELRDAANRLVGSMSSGAATVLQVSPEGIMREIVVNMQADGRLGGSDNDPKRSSRFSQAEGSILEIQ